jgi:uncharacterized protein YdhG (YjbR/CyaY superfamily)
MKKFKDVDEYIAKAAKGSQPILLKLREFIKETLPKCEEKIWYNVPFYHLDGEVVGFSVLKKHVSVGVGADVMAETEREKLEAAGYHTGKGTFQIKFDQKIPAEHLKRLLKTKVKLNQQKQP